MQVFRLDIKDADGNIIETVEGSFSASDIDVLRLFNTAMQRVRTTELLKRGLPTMTHFGLSQQQGLTVTCAAVTDAELHELLHVLRHVTLHRERTSFDNVSALLKKGFANRRFSDVMKDLKGVFENGLLAGYMQFFVGPHPIFDKSLLDNWLNGTQYHTDGQKAEEWKMIECALQAENARGFIMTQIHGRVYALLVLDHIAGVVAQNTPGASLTLG
jgi:hypothetical protein